MAASRSKSGATYDDLVTAFTSGRFEPLYFFYGEEGFLMDELQALAIDRALQPHEKDFNLDIVFGPEASAQAVLAQCAQYPMMAERRLIVVRGFEKLDQNALFKEYAENPSPHATVLLLCSNKPNLSTHPYRALKQNAVAVEFAPLKSRQMPAWIERRFKLAGASVDGAAAQALAEMSGTDLRTVAGEVEKLVTYVGNRKSVTRDDVVRAAGHSRDENPFQLQDAIVAGDVGRALGIADALLVQAGNRRGEALKLVGLLTAYINKVWRLTGCLAQGIPEQEMARQIGVPPFFVRDYVKAARRMGPHTLRRAFEALLAADTELKGASHRDERLILTLALRRIVSHQTR